MKVWIIKADCEWDGEDVLAVYADLNTALQYRHPAFPDVAPLWEQVHDRFEDASRLRLTLEPRDVIETQP